MWACFSLTNYIFRRNCILVFQCGLFVLKNYIFRRNCILVFQCGLFVLNNYIFRRNCILVFQCGFFVLNNYIFRRNCILVFQMRTIRIIRTVEDTWEFMYYCTVSVGYCIGIIVDYRLPKGWARNLKEYRRTKLPSFLFGVLTIV